KYELDNRQKRGMLSKAWGPFASHPDMTASARSGSPQMEGFRPSIPATVPGSPSAQLGTTDVTATTVGDPNAINTQPDARSAAAQAAAAGTAAPGTAAPGATGVTATTPAATTPVAVTRSGADLNTASEAEITKMVGKALAKRVMAFRPYTSVQDLIKAGVPQKTIDRLKPAAPAATAKSGTK